MSLPATAGVQGRSVRRLAGIAAAATYGLMLTGSTFVASSADEGCHAWPLCGNGFALSFTGADAFSMLHRGSVLLIGALLVYVLFFFQAEDGIRDRNVTGVQTCALPICDRCARSPARCAPARSARAARQRRHGRRARRRPDHARAPRRHRSAHRRARAAPPEDRKSVV